MPPNKTTSETEITQRILSAKKYKGIYEKTVERVVADCFQRYPERLVESQARQLLHQIWGAYYKKRPKFTKLFEKTQRDIQVGKDLKQVFATLLRMQSSTRERVSYLDQFYRQIFAVTGEPSFVLDHACGLNPLTYLWMELPATARYLGCDIDKQQILFLQQVLKLTEMDKQVNVSLGDILVDKFEPVDVVFLLKVLPLLEKQEKGSSIRVLREQSAKYLVVSFPTRSLSGKQKGMIDFYTDQFLDLIKNEPWKITKLLFETELVFVVEK